jgi:hypothetical protein
MQALAMVDHDAYCPDYLRGILARARTIAIIGASPSRGGRASASCATCNGPGIG